MSLTDRKDTAAADSRTQYFLAVDIGASGGRHILVHMEDGRLAAEEVYRFPNGVRECGGHLCWDHARIFREIVNGLKRCAELGRIPSSLGIDTWGVDFVLLDRDARIVSGGVSYRDPRTEGMMEEVDRIIPREELYARTGIQFASYNSIYQLMAVLRQDPGQLARAEKLLFTPDYFNYLLTGKAVNEYTVSTTSQLMDPVRRDWDRGLIRALGLPDGIFGEIAMPGTVLGRLLPEIREEVGFDCEVLNVTSHDTASAVLAVPALTDPFIYISSGTWSLIGTELEEADCSPAALRFNMANEGGYGGRFRFLRNVIGMWMIQELKRQSGTPLSYDEICRGAAQETVPSLIDCSDSRYLAPEDMAGAIAQECRETGQPVPDSLPGTARVIYRSLAQCYARTIAGIEAVTGQCCPAVHIVGGGSNAAWLNELTAQASGKTVYAGPAEGTAIGNAGAQMLAAGVFRGVPELRRCIFDSFDVRTYLP